MLEPRLANPGRWLAALRKRAIVSMLALGLFFSGATAVFAHDTADTGPNAIANAAALSAAYRQVADRGTAVEVEGTLQILHEHRRDGTSGYHYFLESNGGERLELFFGAEAPTHLLTDAAIRVKGLRADHAIAVESGTRDIVTVFGPTSSLVSPLAVVSGTLGAQRVAVILVNFSDNPVQPYTPAQIAPLFFTTASDWEMENSYGQTSLTGDVFGWYTIATSSTVCSTGAISSQAKAAAAADGVNLSNYNRLVFAYPHTPACGSGYGTVGGNPSSSWFNGELDLRGVVHEMGHNLGLYHSHALDCGTESIGPSCTSIEYGDQFDVMGRSSFHFNAFQKERLGWLNHGASPPIKTVTTTGTYVIDGYETVGSTPKALKIPIDTSGNFYYVELRRPVGFDAGLSHIANLMNGVLVHQGSPSNANSTQLLDMTPSSAWEWADPALVVGQSFTDAFNQITITPVQITATNATVAVTFGTAGCVRADPSIVLSPAQSAAVAGGTMVSFTAGVTNNDNAKCPVSKFDLTSTVPAGWTGTYASLTLSLSPGISSWTTLQVTSPASASGSNPITATARNHGATAYAATASATYVVVGGTCTRANPTVTLSPATSAGVTSGTAVSFTLSVTNKDSATCASSTFDLTDTVPSGFSATLSSAALSLSPNAIGTATLQVTSPASATNGSKPVTATATNHGATSFKATTSASYVVSNTGGGTTGTFSDDFNRPDNTSIGTAWTQVAGSFVINGNMLKNAPQPGSAVAVVSALSGGTQTASADFTSVDNNLGPRFGIVLSYQNPTNYYLLYRQTGGASRLLISKVVNGVETVLKTASIGNPPKGAPFKLTGSISGTTLKLDFNGVTKVTVTDATFSTGKVGIMVGTGGNFQQQADNFTATVQ